MKLEVDGKLEVVLDVRMELIPGSFISFRVSHFGTEIHSLISLHLDDADYDHACFVCVE